MTKHQGQVKGGSRRSPASKKDNRTPTPDQMYLASRLNGEAAFGEVVEDVPASHRVTPAAIQKWNIIYGVDRVTAALRMAWGFPPLTAIENPYAYVQGVLRNG